MFKGGGGSNLVKILKEEQRASNTDSHGQQLESIADGRGTRVFALNVVCNHEPSLWKLIEILS